MSWIVQTTVRGKEKLRSEIRNVRTQTETLTCSATCQSEWRRTPVDVERPLDATTGSAPTPRTRRDAGLGGCVTSKRHTEVTWRCGDLHRPLRRSRRLE